jgi:hypothetical protein
MSYDALRDYVQQLLANPDPLTVRIEPSVVKPDQIESKPHGEYAGLQVADAVASSFYCAAQIHPMGFTEPRYVECLRPTLYRQDRNPVGYGVKFWPKESLDQVSNAPEFEWVARLNDKK